MKIVPRDSWEALSLSHEGRVYIKLRHLWDTVVPRLMACGLDGEDKGYLLATRLVASSRHFDPRSDGHLLPEVQQALQAVHDAGVVHGGDLRLDNILVEVHEGICGEAEGRRKRVWLIDFGLAEVDVTEQQRKEEMHDLLRLLLVS